ncbi:MAG: hypothetical protein AMXMBFR84_04450 [Candidatus Hydrogenedentota bacterium]
MPFFQPSEYQIGRGEVAESRFEVPFIAGFMLFCGIGLFIFQVFVGDEYLTLALAATLLIFGVTMFRVELGVYILVIGMLLSPEVETGSVGFGHRELNIRYNDFLIMVVFMGVLVKQVYEKRAYLWLPSPVNIAIVLYFTVCLISTALAYDRNLPLFDEQTAAFTLLKMLQYYMLFALVGLAIRNRTQIKRLLATFFVTAVISSLYGIYARFALFDRVSAPFEKGGTEPNTFGGYLVLVMCIALSLMIHAPTRKLRMLFLAIALAAFSPFLFTLSRASYIAFLAALIVIGLVNRKYSFVVLVGLICLVYPYVMPEDVVNRVNYTFQQGYGVEVEVAGQSTGLQVDKSTHERIYVWQKVWYNLHVWPWLGGGVTWDRVMDSQYARVFIETGIVGFIAFLFLQLKLFQTARESYLWTSDWLYKGLGVGVFVITAALIVQSLGTISFLIIRIMEPYWFLFALACVARHNCLTEYYEYKQAQLRATREAALNIVAPTPAHAR